MLPGLCVCGKSNPDYDENGEIAKRKDEYMDGTGTMVFHGNGSFPWYGDRAADREDSDPVIQAFPQIARRGYKEYTI